MVQNYVCLFIFFLSGVALNMGLTIEIQQAYPEPEPEPQCPQCKCAAPQCGYRDAPVQSYFWDTYSQQFCPCCQVCKRECLRKDSGYCYIPSANACISKQ